MAYETFGDPGDVPILLVMGLAPRCWPGRTSFCALLADRGHYVIRFDNRDIGLSTHLDDAPPGQPVAAFLGRRPAYLVPDMADDTAGLIDELGSERACRRRLDGRLHQPGAGPGPSRTLIRSLTLDLVEHRRPAGSAARGSTSRRGW